MSDITKSTKTDVPATEPAYNTEKKDKSDTGTNAESIDEFGGLVDVNTFNQLLEMDDDDDHEFSKSLVFGFFEQAAETFQKMDEHIEKKDLQELSKEGHFLKGSAAALGLTKVRDECEKIQHHGAEKDVDGTALGKDESLEKIKAAYTQGQADFEDVKKILKAYYNE